MTHRIRTSGFMAILGCLCAGLFLWVDGADAADRQAVIQRSRVLLAEAQAAFAAGQSDTALARLDSVLVEDPANPAHKHPRMTVKPEVRVRLVISVCILSERGNPPGSCPRLWSS